MPDNNIEIEKIKAEISSIKFNQLMNLVKIVLMIIGAIILFIAVKNPESILNRKVSEESIRIERAKMLLELTKNNKNYNEILLGITLIKEAYPSENKWLDNIGNLYKTKLKRKTLTLNKDTKQDIKQKLNSLYSKLESLQYQLLLEISGKGTSQRAGYGVSARKIRDKIDSIKTRIYQIKKHIK